MNKTVSILGCGWLGIPLARRLIHEGYAVKGSTTSPDKLDQLATEGIKPFLVDIGDMGSSIEEFLKAETLVIAITSKNVYDFEQLIGQIHLAEIRSVIFISSTSVYPNTNGVVTEDTQTKPTALAHIEELFRREKKFQTTVIRFGGLFGFNRKPGNFIPKSRKMKNPDGSINLIHQTDCVEIIYQIISQHCYGHTLNACADTHPTRREFYTKEALKLGYPTPDFDETSPSEFKIVSNEKLKGLLGFEFKLGDLMSYEG